MVHLRPSLSATNAAGIIPTSAITAISAYSSPVTNNQAHSDGYVPGVTSPKRVEICTQPRVL